MAHISNSLYAAFDGFVRTSQSILDALFPPEDRKTALAKLKAFVISNPKLSAFLLANIALTGTPLLLFVIFALTVFTFSVLVALAIGVLVVLGFTFFAVGVALVIALPTMFMTTFAACSIYFWGMVGYHILRWFNEGKSPVEEGTAIGNILNSLTGGRLSWFISRARKNSDAQNKVQLSDSTTDNTGYEGYESKKTTLNTANVVAKMTNGDSTAGNNLTRQVGNVHEKGGITGDLKNAELVLESS